MAAQCGGSGPAHDTRAPGPQHSARRHRHGAHASTPGTARAHRPAHRGAVCASGCSARAPSVQATPPPHTHSHAHAHTHAHRDAVPTYTRPTSESRVHGAARTGGRPLSRRVAEQRAARGSALRSARIKPASTCWPCDRHAWWRLRGACARESDAGEMPVAVGRAATVCASRQCVLEVGGGAATNAKRRQAWKPVCVAQAPGRQAGNGKLESCHAGRPTRRFTALRSRAATVENPITPEGPGKF